MQIKRSKAAAVFLSGALVLGTIVSGAFAFRGLLAFAQARKPRVIEVLALDFNQDAETQAFKKLVKGCPNVKVKELTGPNAQDREGSAHDRLLRLCESGYKPDFFQISGHYAAQWSGKEDRGSLTLDELEKLSCDPKCRGFFGNARVGMFLACNNLLGAPKKGEIAADYINRLVRDHQGEFDLDAMLAASLDMYESADGSTNAARLSAVFKDAGALLGFAGGAPLSTLEMGQSDKGVVRTWERFKESLGAANFCSAIEALFDQNDSKKRSERMKRLSDAWVKSMNEAEAVGQDAVALCPDCLSHSGKDAARNLPDVKKNPADELPREVYCALTCEDPVKQIEAFRTILNRPKWLSKYFKKLAVVVQGFDEPTFGLLSADDRKKLAREARMRLAIAPSLLHKWASYGAIKRLEPSAAETLTADLGKEFMELARRFEKSQIEADEKKRMPRDLFRAIVQRAPVEIVKNTQDALFGLFDRSNKDPQLKSDLGYALTKVVTVRDGKVFHSGRILNQKKSADGRRQMTTASDHTVKIVDSEPDGSVKPVAMLYDKERLGSGAVDLSSDGRMIAVGGGSKIEILRIAPDGKLEKVAENDEDDDWFIRAVAFSPDRRRLLKLAGNGNLGIYDLNEGESGVLRLRAVVPMSLDPSTAKTTGVYSGRPSAAFSSSGKRVAVISGAYTVDVNEISADGKETKKLASMSSSQVRGVFKELTREHFEWTSSIDVRFVKGSEDSIELSLGFLKAKTFKIAPNGALEEVGADSKAYKSAD